MKHYALIACSLVLLLCACQPQQDIVVLFDNDAHCAVDGYAMMAAMRDSVLEQTPYVAVVSAGDFVQGDVVGSISRGQY
ncbi:MAG: hypothetical protein KBS42_04285, partial [Bacteroidales bacterium]|nr:hypothetical protein [Candidatus Colicola coprequi]